ncbi:hypothetical protein OBBRIDRAFT_545615 [Obba rivulosa]|uniref:Copper-fist domain-containing protein n=1 Tax=Obba rivulosa TaxID=1052685 RepID=A0A8E2AZW1_9APHY|nr:hypothetical protein OBBRIDRAFT_545615 [Obba rivulosa]
MVYVADKKYACESCIKGHRSSTCRHIGRPLYEIKSKGRPVTQCTHCRELRKTKQIHVKCTCGDHSGATGGLKAAATPAFPNGLPEALRTSGLLHVASDGSDSEHSSAGSSRRCDCGDRVHCTCASSYSTFSKRRERVHERPSSRNARRYEGSMSRPTEPGGLVARAHPKDLRPVFPKLSPEPQVPVSAHDHDSHGLLPQTYEQSRHVPYDSTSVYSRGTESAAQYDPQQSWDFDIPFRASSDAMWMPQSTAETLDAFHALYECGPTCLCKRSSPNSGSLTDSSATGGCLLASFANSGPTQGEPQTQTLADEHLQRSLPNTHSFIGSQLDSSQLLFNAQPPPPSSPFAFSQASSFGATFQGNGKSRHLTQSIPASGRWCNQCARPAGSCVCPESTADTDMRAALEFALSGERATYHADADGDGGMPPEMGWESGAGLGNQLLGVTYPNLSRGSSFSSGSSNYSSTASSTSASFASSAYSRWLQ